MNIQPNIPSSGAEAKEVIGNSVSSKLSETKEGKTSEGVSVQPVDNSEEHEAMEKAASCVPTPDLQDALHGFRQVRSSGHPHLGVGRKLTDIENTLGSLQLQLEYDHIAAPSSVGELRDISKQFRNVSVHLEERYDAAAGSVDYSDAVNQEILGSTRRELDQLDRQLGGVNILLDSLEEKETDGDTSAKGINDIRSEITALFSIIMESSNNILTNLHFIESRSNTPPSSNRTSDSKEDHVRKATPEELKSTIARPQTTFAGGRSDRSSQPRASDQSDMKWDDDVESSEKDAKLDSSSALPPAGGSRRARADGIDQYADAKPTNNIQQDQKKGAIDEEHPETNSADDDEK